MRGTLPADICVPAANELPPAGGYATLLAATPREEPGSMPSSQQVDADLSYLVVDEAKDLLVGRRPVEVAVRPDEARAISSVLATSTNCANPRSG
jgi:hypothetical protein